MECMVCVVARLELQVASIFASGIKVQPSCRKSTQLELAFYLKLLVRTDNIDLT